ncbi:MAG: tyrosine--tRNA ligase, partial [Desulfobacterales bacterium]
DMFGKIMSISDDLMWRFYELLSSVSVQELEKIREQAKAGTLNPKNVKADLAREIVTRYHSESQAQEAAKEFENIFRKKELPDEIPLAKTWGAEPKWICKVLVDESLTKSSSEARRLIQQGAVSIDGEKVSDPNQQLSGNQEYLIKVGKKKFLKITPG